MPDGIPEEAFFDISNGDEVIAQNSGLSKAFFPNTISFFYDFRGPSMAIDTNCSGAMVALHTAVTHILNGN